MIKRTILWLGGRFTFYGRNFNASQPCKYFEDHPPAIALAPIGLANLSNPTKAVVPSDELIESHLRAYLSATPRGQRTLDSFLHLKPSRTRSLIKAFVKQHFARCRLLSAVRDTRCLELIHLRAATTQ
jgi:hypothetical protein